MKWVRPFISIVMALGVNVGFFMDKITAVEYLLVAGGTIVWWFRARDKEKKNGDKNE